MHCLYNSLKPLYQLNSLLLLLLLPFPWSTKKFSQCRFRFMFILSRFTSMNNFNARIQINPFTRSLICYTTYLGKRCLEVGCSLSISQLWIVSTLVSIDFSVPSHPSQALSQPLSLIRMSSLTRQQSRFFSFPFFLPHQDVENTCSENLNLIKYSMLLRFFTNFTGKSFMEA